MKLVLLGLFLLVGIPLAVYAVLGPAALESPGVVMGTIGGVVVLFGMSCILTIKNVLNFFVDFLLVTSGAILLLLAVFAKPLGLLDDPEGQDIERRIMGDPKDEAPAPTNNQHAEAEQQGQPSLDEILDPEQQSKPTQDERIANEAVEPTVGEGQKQDLKQATMPVEEQQSDDESKEGLERFAEESGQD